MPASFARRAAIVSFFDLRSFRNLCGHMRALWVGGQARVVGIMARRGLWATCDGGIVVRHTVRSTEYPVCTVLIMEVNNGGRAVESQSLRSIVVAYIVWPKYLLPK